MWRLFTGDFPVRAAGDNRHQTHPGWPEATPYVELCAGGSVRLRPLMRRDGQRWRTLRIENREFLEPVEPTVDVAWNSAHSPDAWRVSYRYLNNIAQAGQAIPLAIEYDHQLVGQLTLGNIQHGAIRECWIGYWVDHTVTGRGIAQAAVALGVDHAFRRIGLHRVTATYLPANPASGMVLKANGFREEGFLRRNLHINGSWQDHHFMALVVDDFELTAVQRLQERGRVLARPVQADLQQP